MYVLKFISWLKQTIPINSIRILTPKDFVIIGDKSYIEKEKDMGYNFLKQLGRTLHECIIHTDVFFPDRTLYLIWQFVMLSVIVFSYIYYPYVLSFVVPFGQLQKWHEQYFPVLLVLFLIYFIDVIINMNTAYFEGTALLGLSGRVLHFHSCLRLWRMRGQLHHLLLLACPWN